MENHKLKEIFKKTEEIVREAGESLLKYYNRKANVVGKEDGSPVTEADIEVDGFLRGRLGKILPGAGWLSEESEDDGLRIGKRLVWVVDSLDGTREFIKRIPEFAISIALVEGKKPVMGIVYNPASDEMISGFLGGGVYYNGEKINKKVIERGGELIMLSSRTDEKLGLFKKYEDEFEVVPMGSIAYKLAKISIGEGDLMLSETPKNEWDTCAGVFLVGEVGGEVRYLDGLKPNFNNKESRVYGGLIASLDKEIVKEILSRFKSSKGLGLEKQIEDLLDNVNIISIVASGRSGSYFVQSLLDGHENILNIPFYIEMHVMYREISGFIDKGFDVDSIVNYVCKKSLVRNFLSKKNRDIAWEKDLKVMINGGLDHIQIDYEKFSENLREILILVHNLRKLNEKGFYVALNIAYALTTGKRLENIKYVVDQSHYYTKMKILYEIDSKIKFIHTIRDPRASYYSYIEHNKSHSEGNERFLPNFVSNAFNYTFYSMAMVDEYKKKWLNKENYFSIRLEDLHTNFEDVIKKLAEWLEIPVKKELFESTMGGYVWPSKSFTHKRNIIGKDVASTEPKWKKELSRNQIENVEFLSSRFMNDYGYEKVYWTKEKMILYYILYSLIDQLRQIDLFGKDYMNEENFVERIRCLISGRLKLLHYIIFFRPYKC